jgi:hypothetical protein
LKRNKFKLSGGDIAKGSIKTSGTSGTFISSKYIRSLREGATYNLNTGALVNLIEFDIVLTVNEKFTRVVKQASMSLE